MRSFLKPLALISGIALAACAVGQTPDDSNRDEAASAATPGRLMV